jgi:hypothetical protein
MEYFIFVILYAMLCTLSMTNINYKISLHYSVALFVGLIIGLRGIEDEYSRLFIQYSTLSSLFESVPEVIFEKGLLFGLICTLLRSTDLSSQSLLLIFGVASVMIHAVFYRRFTPYYYIAFLLYLSHEIAFKEWTQIRAGFASACVLPAIYYLKNGKTLNFLIITLIAGMIQYVGFLIILLYFFNRKISTKYLLIGLGTALIIPELHFIKDTLFYISNNVLLPQSISQNIINYVGSDNYGYELTIFHPKIIQQLFVLTGILCIQMRFGAIKLPYYNLILNTYYLSTVLFIIFSEIAIFSTRFGGLFYSVEPILLLYIVYYIKQKYFYLLSFITASVILSYYNYIHRKLIEPYEMFL